MNASTSVTVAYIVVGVLLWGYVGLLALQRLRQKQ